MSPKTCSIELLNSLTEKAKASPRKRAHHELHDGGGVSPFQYFLNVMEPGTYVTPHFHGTPGKWEWFQCLRGKAVVLFFDEEGRVTLREELSPDNGVLGLEVPVGQWHTVASLKSGTALLEMKPGPYLPDADKNFASWAPGENEPLMEQCEAWFHTAQVGDRFFLND